MAYSYYNARNTIPSTPTEDWKNDLQAIVDSEFSNASSYYTIQEEISVGSTTWQNAEVRINHTVYSNTGEKLGDDFKSIIFQDFTHARGMGYRYNFDSNIWITVNTDQKKYVTASAIIRRCNNILQKRDANGNLIQEPCFIDYGYASDSFNIFKESVLADGEILVCAQNNINTRLFDIDDRVLFGGQAFKIESKKNFLNNTTYGNNDNPLIVWKMCKVDLNEYDDLVNNIADNTVNTYVLKINQDTFNNVIGYSSTLSATVKLNGDVVSKSVTWSSSAPTKVLVTSGGTATLLATGSAVITCAMADNTDIKDTITITVVAITTPVTEIRILPDVTYLIQGDPAQVYTVYKYINNVQQADAFTFTTSGVAISKYECTVISGNSFSVKNILRDNSNTLTILCTDNVDASTETIQITLGGLY